MGATASRQVGRVLSEVEQVISSRPVGDHNPPLPTMTHTSFPKWAETCFGDVDPTDMLKLITEDTRRAKHKHGAPMSLFPAKVDGEDEGGTGERHWVPSCSWKPPIQGNPVGDPSTEVRFDTGIASIVEEVVMEKDTRSAIAREAHITIGAHQDPEAPQPSEPQALSNISLRIEEIPSLTIEEVYNNVRCGDHIFYVGRELISMEHHMVVVKKLEYPDRTDPKQSKHVIIAAGVMAERWADTTLCYIDVGNAMRGGTRIHRVVATWTGGLHNWAPIAPRDAVELALASIGMSYCWNGSSFNCEDWANWVTTGWAFSLQRTRAFYRRELQGDILVTPILKTHMIDVASRMHHVPESEEDEDVPLKLGAFPINVEALRDVRVDVCTGLEEYENF